MKVDDEIIWDAAINDIPVLKEMIIKHAGDLD